ncbi:NAD(P)H-hydrate epimerase [Herbiconiux daphne]|uniref:NAD(P)H-hydrate epimerase n=1 Tax=Herbiconiux daphne TaxID=2970914 RepID=A0ABT2H8K7_9MICO|nr:NAD(P)H-hydrate epimerase [Herbiconiux daphne]MCS5736263.1 NAD(P)H-hydrate epimerase [Herbiconiux daphne]
MIRGYTSQQVRDAEAPHLAAGEPLMQRAAHALAGRIREVLEQRGHVRPPRVLLLVGSGDNGGDALFAGAELAAEGVEVVVVGVGSRLHEAGRAAAEASGAVFGSPTPFDPQPAALAALAREAVGFDVVVDGIVGTGTTSRSSTGAPGSPGSTGPTGSAASSALRGTARAVVQALLPAVTAEDTETRSSPQPQAQPHPPAVVAVDIPSGIDPDTGAAPDPVVLPATVTVTFGGIKAGLLRGDGPRLAGRVVLVEIGIDDELGRMTPAVELPATSVPPPA